MGASVDRVNAFACPGAQASRRAGAFVRSRRSLRIDQIAKKSNQLGGSVCRGNALSEVAPSGVQALGGLVIERAKRRRDWSSLPKRFNAPPAARERSMRRSGSQASGDRGARDSSIRAESAGN